MPAALFGPTFRSLEFQTCPMNAAPLDSFPGWRSRTFSFSAESFLIAATFIEAAEPRGAVTFNAYACQWWG